MIKVKPYEQTAGWSSCGPASLKMIFDFYGLRLGEKELIKICGTTKSHGADAKDLARAVRHFGFKIKTKDFADFSDVNSYLKRKIPVIVDWFSGDDGHYSVAVGLDKKHIYLADPEFGEVRKMEREKFRRVWFDFPGNYIKKKNEIILRRVIIVYK